MKIVWVCLVTVALAALNNMSGPQVAYDTPYLIRASSPTVLFILLGENVGL